MRQAQSVDTLRCIRHVVAFFSGIRLSRRGFCAFLLPFVAATALSLGAAGDDDDDTIVPSNPVIEEFQVIFDGIDQYWITGIVTGCEELGDLEVTFGDSASGHTTTTAPDGSFGHLVILSETANNTFSAQATSRDGVNSPWAVFYFY